MLGVRLMFFGVIKNFFKIIAHALYYVISFLHLTPLILLLVIGLIIELTTSSISGGGIVAGVFKLLVALSIVYAVLKTAGRILGFGNKRKHKKSTAEIVEPKKRKKLVAESQTEEKSSEIKTKKEVYPKYFKAKQNPNYVFAEYEDRYELFKIEKGKYAHVRTDYK